MSLRIAKRAPFHADLSLRWRGFEAQMPKRPRRRQRLKREGITHRLPAGLPGKGPARAKFSLSRSPASVGKNRSPPRLRPVKTKARGRQCRIRHPECADARHRAGIACREILGGVQRTRAQRRNSHHHRRSCFDPVARPAGDDGARSAGARRLSNRPGAGSRASRPLLGVGPEHVVAAHQREEAVGQTRIHH